ncbi:MAG: HAD-IB family phosphatase [Gemmatimonadaceae bacterium]|nr:HAD-IB family phosphatase [Gemmatimonadaceae bacterium]
MTLKFSTIILDVDSTLSRIEGIEWLARLRGEEVFARINDVTERAMRGELEFDGVYAARLDAVRPTREEMQSLALAYVDNISPGAEQAVARLMAAGARVMIVSGGMLEPVLHLASHVGISSADVHAVPVFFDENGEYAGYDHQHPCSRQLGKRTVVSGLKLDRPILLVGDGMTDAEVKPVVDSFAAFTGAVRREKIVELANFEITSFSQLFEHISA